MKNLTLVLPDTFTHEHALAHLTQGISHDDVISMIARSVRGIARIRPGARKGQVAFSVSENRSSLPSFRVRILVASSVSILQAEWQCKSEGSPQLERDMEHQIRSQ